jgi:hypothetical protein
MGRDRAMEITGFVVLIKADVTSYVENKSDPSKDS